MGTTTDTGLAQMLLQGCQQGTWFVDHPLRLKRGPNFMYMKVTSIGITLIFTWKPECFPQFCHPKKFWILTDRTTKFWQSSWCNVQNSFWLSSFWSSRCAADALVATAAVKNLKMWPQILTSEKRFIFTTPSSLFTAALQKNPNFFACLECMEYIVFRNFFCLCKLLFKKRSHF